LETNRDYLTPIYKKLYKIDLADLLTNMRGVAEIEEKLNWKVCQAKSFDEYHEQYSCANVMENIKVPTMFYFCEDDPLINAKCMNFEAILKNDNIIMASTKNGAHLCSYEHFFKIEQWLPKPAFEFFGFFRQNEGPNPRLNRSDTSDDIEFAPALLEASSVGKET
jgi:predicted alpha/beta-fold hydrolase